MEENNKLIPIANNSLIQKTTVSLAITNKLLAENYRKLILEIAERNPQLIINCYTENHPINIEEYEILNKYCKQTIKDIDIFLINKKIIWSIELIEKLKENFNFSFKEEYFFYSFGLNSTFNLKILNEYYDELDYKFLSYNENLPWSNELIEKFKDKWDWDWLSWNKSLPWSEDFFEKHIEKWNWEMLSGNKILPWSEDFFDKYFDKWCNTKARRFEKDGQYVWIYNSENDNQIWYLGAIECIINRNGELIKTLFWVKTTLGENSLKEFIKEDIIDLNKGLIKPIQQFSLKPFYKGQEEDIYNNLKLGRYSITSLATNEDAIKLDRKFIYLKETSNIPIPQILSNKNVPFWSNLSSNKSLPWSEEFIEKHIDRWDWFNLSSNESLPWSLDFFKKYIEKWNWNMLSMNENLPWSEDFFEEHIEKWNWNNLSRNKNLPWSEDFFEKNIERWKWNYLSKNENLTWSIEFIEKYRENWNWRNLSYNGGLKWNINLIQKYAEKIESSEIIWDCIKEYVDVELIIEILNKNE